MNTLKRFARICALSAVASLLVALCAATPSQAATVVASLRSVAGPVDILRGGALPAIPAKNGDQVASGDLIRTKSGGFAEVAYTDGTLLRIAERSRVDIGEHFSGKSPDSSEVRLTRGKVKAIVDLQNVKSSGTGPKKFEVRTPNAIAGVRGTGFTTSHERGVTSIYVDKGTVYTLNPKIPGKVETLTQNMITTVSGSNAPAKGRQALPGEVQKMEKGTTAPPAGSSSGGGTNGAAKSDKGAATSDKGETSTTDKGEAKSDKGEATSDKGDTAKSDKGETAKSDKGETAKSDKGETAKSDKGDNGGGTASGGTAASADSGGTAASTGAGGTTAAAETTGTAGSTGTTGTTDTAGTTGTTVTAGSAGTAGTTETASSTPAATGTAKIAVTGGGISTGAPAAGISEVFMTAPSLPVLPMAGARGGTTSSAPLLNTLAQGAGAVIQNTTSTPVPTNANTAAPSVPTQTIAPVQPKPSTANVKINVNF